MWCLIYGIPCYSADAEWFKSFKPGMTVKELGDVINKQHDKSGWAWNDLYLVNVAPFVEKKFSL